MLGVSRLVKSISVVLAAWLMCACGGDGLNAQDNQKAAEEKEPEQYSLPVIGQVYELSSADTKVFEVHTDTLDDASVWAVWLENHGDQDQLMIRRYLSKNYLWNVSATRLDSSSGDARLAQLAIDAVGSVTALWTQDNAVGRSELHARYYNKYHGRWRAADVIDSPNIAGDSDSPLVVAHSQGQVSAIWRQLDGAVWRLMGSNYEPTIATWSEPVMIGNGTGSVDGLQLAVDLNGTVTALWREFDGLVSNLWVTRRGVGGAWATAAQLSDRVEGSVLSAKLVVDIGGNAVVAWVQDTAGVHRLWVTRYDKNQQQWQVATSLSSSSSSVGVYDLAVTPNTEVTVAWLQDNGVVDQLWLSRFQNNAWQASKAMGAGVNPTDDFLLLVDDRNKTTLTWRETANNGQSLWSQHYWAGWRSVERVDQGLDGAVLNSLASVVDVFGNVTLAWLSNIGQYQDVSVNRYNMNSGWQGADVVEALNEGDASDPRLLVDGRGDVTLAWSQYHDSDNHLLASRYPLNLARWGEVNKIDLRTSGEELNFDVIVDETGDVTSFWLQQGDEAKALWSNRF